MYDPFQARHRDQPTNGDLGTWDQLRLAFRLYRDPRVSPLLKWAVPLVAAIYVVSPVDVIPDVLLGVGQIDDVGVLGLMLVIATNVIRRLAPNDIVDEHLGAMRGRGSSSRREASPRERDVIETTFRVEDSAHRP